ncbi:MAG TPA: DUF2066 domain-containing protein [Methyloceanibacter sp.]|nr:DUF2066 domain-containing protein [Methyloceanibacter sp.]
MALWRLKLVAGAGLLLLPCVFATNLSGVRALAADGLYEVAKISVDTTAADAVAARTMGMAEAQARAIKTVLQRLVPAGAEAQLPELSNEDIEGLVNGVSIRSEQNSTTRYIATLDVSVSEQGIKQLLHDYGVPYSEERAPSISILPILVQGGSIQSDEDWRRAWDDLDLAHSMTPATILRARPELSFDAVKAVLAGDAQTLESMQAEYGYGALVLAVGEVAGGKFVTRLAGADGVGALDYGQSEALGGNAKAAQREAAALAFAVIENRWKMSQSGEQPATEVRYEEGGVDPPAAAGEPSGKTEVPRNVVAMVEFQGLKDWQDIRGRLMQVAGIQAVEVNSLSARGASITFDYAGPLGRLQTALGQNGFVFDERDGTFVLRSR